MKPPVLRVRRGAQYYDDAPRAQPAATAPERGNGPQEPGPQSAGRPRRRGGGQGRRRGRRLLFLPLVVLALGLAVVLSLRPAPGTARFADWDVRMQAGLQGNQIVLALTFTSRRAASSMAPATALIHAFLPDTGASADVSGDLSATPSTLRALLPMAAAVKGIRANVTIGGETHQLSLGR